MTHVVCIIDKPWRNRYGRLLHNPPRKGQVYTVTKSRTRSDNRTFHRLAEYGPRTWFSADHFRPLPSTRLSIFREQSNDIHTNA